MDDKTAKAVKALGINAKSEEDARKQILGILEKNQIEGMEDEDLSTLIDIAEALVNDNNEADPDDENDALANEVDEENEENDDDDDDEEGDEDDDKEGEDELEDMDRSELKAYIKEHELDVKVTKKMEDDDIRQAIRDAEAEEGDDNEEENEEPEPEPKKAAKGKKEDKKSAKAKKEEPAEEPEEKPSKKSVKADKKADKKAAKEEKKEGGRKKTKIDPKGNKEDRKVFDKFKELFPEDSFNYNWVEGGVTIKHRGENSERGVVCMKPFYRKEDGLVGNMYIAALTNNTDVLDKNDIEYGFHWNNAPEMKGVTIDEAYEILETVQDAILEKVQKIDKKLGDNKAKMEKNLNKKADKKEEKKEEKKADAKASTKEEKKADKKANKKSKK